MYDESPDNICLSETYEKENISSQTENKKKYYQKKNERKIK